ncbi:hypothetical protein [Hyphococcus sp.]|uniref:hypothetical protein n=1 Tax=Hyphococcus sp. TaxID=2038636 RepID=UPI00208BDA3D|nr:MAG: hypothetical protein DHS20C04_16360 [Marinicaulis sp.]
MKSSNKDTGTDIRAQLVEAGVPQAVAEYADSMKPSGWVFQALSWIFILIMVLGFIGGAFLWAYFENILDQNAQKAAANAGAVLYQHNFGIAGLFALFGWIFAAAVITGQIQLLSDKLLSSAFVETILDPKNRLYLSLENYLDRLRAYEHEPREYMKRACLGWINYILWPTVILFSLAAATLERELHTYDYYTLEGYVEKPLFPWESEKVDYWSNASYAELGCNHVTGKNASDDIIYDVTFQNGNSLRPSNALPVTGTWLDRIEQIDRVLVSEGTKFKRWSWLKRNPLHPSCMASYRKKWSSTNYERLESLLRVDEL